MNAYQARQTAFIKDKNQVADLIANSLIARFIVFLVTVSIIFTISFLLNKPESLKIFIRLAAISMGINIFMGGFASALLGFERFKLYGVLAMGTQLVLTALSFVALYFGYGLVGVGVVYIINALFATFVVGLTVRLRVCRFSLMGKLKPALEFLKSSLPLALTAVLMTIYYRADLVMLSIFKGDQAVGFYNSAYALVNGMLLVSTSFSAVIMPRLSGFYKENIVKMNDTYQIGFKYLLYFGMAVATGAYILAEPLYSLIYPESYLGGVVALKILIWALALMFINSIQNSYLVAINNKSALLYITGIGAVLNIILNLFLIPRYSFQGAAVATLISELAAGTLFFVLIKKNLGIKKLLRWIIHLAPSLLLMVLFLIFVENIHVILRIIGGGLIFIAILILTRGLDRRDLQIFFRLLPLGQK